MGIDVSFVICCYNSEDSIGQTLNSVIRASRQSNFTTEIIVVDNRSTDSTREVSEQTMRDFEFQNGKVILEEKAGQMHARLKGSKNATGRFLAFVDDDNEIFDDWLLALEKAEVEYESIGMIGSLALKKGSRFPSWFEQYQTSYACGNFSRTSGELNSGILNYGAGMVISRNVWSKIEKILEENCHLGRCETSLGAGDDGLINELVDELGYKRIYCPSMKLYHNISKSRLTWDHLIRLQAGFGEGSMNIIIAMLKVTKSRKHYYLRRLLFLLGRSIFDITKGYTMKIVCNKKYMEEPCNIRLLSVRGRYAVRAFFKNFRLESASSTTTTRL